MTRVLIATNQPIKATGLEAILIAGGMDVVAVCHDVFEIFECLHQCRPDVAVLDTPVLLAPEVIQDLRRLAPQCQLVGWPQLTLSDSPARVVEALLMMANFSGRAPSPSALVNLACSTNEREIISLAGYGLNTEEIAAAKGCDRSTVQQLLRSVGDRLGTEDRYDLALYGLSTLNEAEQEEGSIEVWKDEIETV
jgi:DNA-binding NarL/FixJ family response regulator